MSDQVFENECGILRYHPDGIVHHEFKGRAVGEPFRQLLLKGLEVLKKKGARRWLSDDRKHSVLAEDDEKWAHVTWFPQAAAAGWKYWAVINPEKAVGQMQHARTMKTMELGGVKVVVVSTVEQGLEWLRTVEGSLKKVG